MNKKVRGKSWCRVKVFIINRLARDVPLSETINGVMPVLASDFIRIALLLAFPSIALGQVRTFGGRSHATTTIPSTSPNGHRRLP